MKLALPLILFTVTYSYSQISDYHLKSLCAGSMIKTVQVRSSDSIFTQDVLEIWSGRSSVWNTYYVHFNIVTYFRGVLYNVDGHGPVGRYCFIDKNTGVIQNNASLEQFNNAFANSKHSTQLEIAQLYLINWGANNLNWEGYYNRKIRRKYRLRREPAFKYASGEYLVKCMPFVKSSHKDTISVGYRSIAQPDWYPTVVRFSFNKGRIVDIDTVCVDTNSVYRH